MPAQAMTPAPTTYECTSCGATHHTAGGLPVGWSAIPAQGAAWCPDCTVTGTPAQRASRVNRKAA